MKKLLPLLFLLLSNVFIAVAGTNPPGGSIAYVTPMCHTSVQQNVIRNGLTLGGTFSSSPAGLTINAVTGDVFPIISQPGIYVVTYLVAPTQQDPAYMTNATVVIIPEVMPQFVSTSSMICSGSTALALPTTSTNGITGTWSPATIDNTQTATYTFTPNIGQCAQSTTYTVTVLPLPIASISGSTTVNQGNTATIMFDGTPNATVTYFIDGGPLQTILLNAAGSATLSTPTLTGPTNYCLISVESNGILHCTNTVTGCATINVMLAVEAPVGSPNQTFPQGATLADVVVSGSNIKWYANAVGRNVNATPLPMNTLLVNGATYFASQTINGFESENRLAVTVQVTLANSQFDFKDLTYSPNPVEQVLNIKSSEAFKTIKIYNNLGQEVYQQNANAFDLNLDLGFLKTGNYFIKIASDKKHQVIQVIKK